MAIVAGTRNADVASAAELERRRLQNQAAQARSRAQQQAQAAEAETETQARRAIAETERQAQTARSEAEQEAESRQATIRKQRGTAEREAQAAMSKARKARNIEQRKRVLPYTKPQNLGTKAYISAVETARKQAHRSGETARAAVTKVRDNYFKAVDKAKADTIADINKQKAGIVRDIQAQLVNLDADITKQLAQANSGIASWEADSKAKIAKAQAEYETAIQQMLNQPGTQVFADMKNKGLVPANAVYQSYDKNTGQINYTLPDTRSGQQVFASLQSENKIPPNATYKSYDSATGEVSYSVDTPNFGSSIFKKLQNSGKIPKDASFISYNATTAKVTYFIPGKGTSTIAETSGAAPTGSGSTTTTSSTTARSSNTANVVAGSLGIMAAAGGIIEAGGAIAAIPTPPTWAIGGVVAAVGLVVGIIKRKQIVENWKRLTGQSSGQTVNQVGDAVVTNKSGTTVTSIHQFLTTPQTKGQSITTFPWAEEKAHSLTTGKVSIPELKGYELKSEQLQPAGVPMISGKEVVMIRDPFDVPELRAKASNVEMAMAAVQSAASNLATRRLQEHPLTRDQYERLQELKRLENIKSRVITGEEYKKLEELRAKYLKPGADVSRSYRLAYEDYLRKKAALDAARKAYVASLNPQPVKGKGSTDAKAAAIGVWLAQDVMQASIEKSLHQGKSLEQALSEAQTQVQKATKELHLTRQQISAAAATVISQVALSNMAQQAIKTATLGRTKGLTATELKTQTLAATKAAAQSIVQTAVDTGTLARTQARALENELVREAEAVTNATLRLKLPKLPKDQAAAAKGEKYPNGTIVWNMGALKGKGDRYMIIPPPYKMDKPITSFKPPKGMTKTKGTPQETLTFIGGKVPFKNVSFDLGVTDGFIDVKSKTIHFTGEGERTNVGTRRPENTRGVALTDNTPLLMQLLKRPRGKHQQQDGGRQPRIRLANVTTPRRTRGRLASRGVYMDRGGTRMTRRRRRGWKRIA